MAGSSLFKSLVVISALSYASADPTWPNGLYNALDSLLYSEQLAIFIDNCPLDINNRSTNAEWLRFLYHDAATHNSDTGTGGVDGSILYELDRPENVGKGMTNTAQEIIEFSNKYVTRADAITAAAISAVVGCNGPIIPFRPGRADAVSAGPDDIHVPQPQDTLASHTESFRLQGFNPSEMIALVACGHTMGGVRNPDFPTLVQPAVKNTFDNIVSFDTTPAFDNAVVTEYMNSTTPNVLVISPNSTMTSDQRIFSSDNNATLTGMMSPSNFTSTCGRLLERLFNTVPSNVTLGDEFKPLQVKVSDFDLSVTLNGTFNLAVSLRLLTPPSAKANISLHWDTANDITCPTCISPSQGSFPLKTSMFAALGYTPLTYNFQVNNIQPFSKFWFEIVDGGNTTTLNNGGGGYPVGLEVLVPGQGLGQDETGHNVTVAVATTNGTSASSVTGFAYLRSPTTPQAPLLPLPPINASITFIPNTWSNLSIPGYELWTATPQVPVGNYAVDLVAMVGGVGYGLDDVAVDLFQRR